VSDGRSYGTSKNDDDVVTFVKTEVSMGGENNTASVIRSVAKTSSSAKKDGLEAAHSQGGNIKVQNGPSVCQCMPAFGSRLPHPESSTTRRCMPRMLRWRIMSEAWMDKEIAAVLYERIHRGDMTSVHTVCTRSWKVITNASDD